MELIAQGVEPQQRWRRRLLPNATVELGRTARGWAVDWDEQISRKHIALTLDKGTLQLHVLPNARNPVFVSGEEVQSTVLQPGDHFVIGQTTFTFSDVQAIASIDQPLPVTEQRYSAEYLRQVRYRDADKRIDVLSRLPDLIESAATNAELYTSIVNVLIRGVPRCNAVAVVKVPGKALVGDDLDDNVEVLHWDCRGQVGEEFRPSEKLIRQSLEKSESTIHIWNERSESSAAMFTQRDNMDWAFCTPVPGAASDGWALYIAGVNQGAGATPSSDHADFRDDLKFAESAAATLGNIRVIKQLERGNAALSQFFSPPVLEVLEVSDPEVVLAPREAEISVLFCDLRGFSLHSERSADDLFGLLDSVSDALGVMTKYILEHGGVVGDFQGDSVMGFWGWPLEQPEGAVQACRAALMIQSEFVRATKPAKPIAEGTIDDTRESISQFGIGVGIATGTAVAGKIGTIDQFKVTVFGPVVNLASRLESMTKQWGVPVLIDSATSEIIKTSAASGGLPEFAIRNLGAVQPAGMTGTVGICQLADRSLAASTGSQGNEEESWLQSFINGDWNLAAERIDSLPESDGVRKFIADYIERHQKQDGGSPDDWDGTIRMSSK